MTFLALWWPELSATIVIIAACWWLWWALSGDWITTTALGVSAGLGVGCFVAAWRTKP